MIRAHPTTQCAPDQVVVGAAIPTRTELTAWLRNSTRWPIDAELMDAAPCRLWVSRDRRITFELRLALARNGLVSHGLLQGGLGAAPFAESSLSPTITSDGWVTGLLVSDPHLGVWCRSPERDEALPGVAALWPGTNADDSETVKPGEIEGGERLNGRAIVHPARGSSVCENQTGQADWALAVVDAMAADGGERANGLEWRTRLIGYRTGKRCVLRVDRTTSAASAGVFVKHFRRRLSARFQLRWEGVAAQMESLSGGRVRLPRLIAMSADGRSAVFEAIPPDARPVTFGESADGVIEALHAVHRLVGEPELATHTVADELETVARWEDGLATVSVNAEHRRILDRLVRDLRVCGANLTDDDLVIVHRDFHAAQLLATASALWIVDWDTLARGHAEVDLATFLAHWILEEARRGHWNGDLAMVDRCVSAYQACGGRVNQDRLRYYVPAALSRLGALHLARGLDGSIVERMWSAADSILGGRR